jgi:hypothetical protein
MAYNLNLQKLIKDLRGPKGLAALTDEVGKMKSEVDRLRESVQPTAQKRLKEIQVQLKSLKSNWGKRQATFEKEVEKTLTQLKKAAKDAEARLEKAVGRKAKTKTRKTTKKAAPKAKATPQKATRSVKKA